MNAVSQPIAAGYDAIADAITMPAEFYAALVEEVGDLRGLRLLDAGCGNGYLLERLSDRGAAGLSGLEYSPELSRRAQARLGERAEITNGSLLEPLPYAEGSFDVITMSEVIEHLPDPVAALRNLRRVLKPGGRLVMTFPNAGAYPLWRVGERMLHTPLGTLLVPMEHPRKTFQPIDAVLGPGDLSRFLRESGWRAERWAGSRPLPWLLEVRLRRPILRPLNGLLSALRSAAEAGSRLPGGHRMCYRVTVVCRRAE